MNSIGEDCNELKTKYDACFNQWFSEKFLRGQTEDSCQPLFKVYQKCVQDALQLHQIDIKDLEQNHIDGKEFEDVKPSEDSNQKDGTSSKSTS